AGLAKVLAVAQSQRLKAVPQLPTAAEAGLPGYEFATWFGIVAPKGTPALVIAALARHIHAMQDDLDVQRSLAASGMAPLKERPSQFGVASPRNNERPREAVKPEKHTPEKQTPRRRRGAATLKPLPPPARPPRRRSRPRDRASPRCPPSCTTTAAGA